MDISVVEILMKLSNDFLLGITVLELVDINPVLPDLAAGVFGAPLIDVCAAPGEAAIQTMLEVMHIELGGGEA